MDINNVFPSNYIKSSDIKAETVVTIKKVFQEQMNQKMKDKVICEFNEFNKPMILNKTNCQKLAQIAGSTDTDKWVGHKVKLYVALTTYQGQETPGLRIKAA